MGPANCSSFDRGDQRFAHRAGMAEEKLNLFFHARANDLRARFQIHFRRNRDELQQRARDAPPFLQYAQARLLHPVRPMCAATTGIGIQPRAFHVKAKAVARIEVDSPGQLGQELAICRLLIGDQRDEKAGAAMRVELLRGVVPGIVRFEGAVEIDAREAVDLDVDQAWSDPGQIENVLFANRDFLEDVLLDLHVADLAGKSTRGDFHGGGKQDQITKFSKLTKLGKVSFQQENMKTGRKSLRGSPRVHSISCLHAFMFFC